MTKLVIYRDMAPLFDEIVWYNNERNESRGGISNTVCCYGS